ncbi:hypothetical protein HDU93_000396, partial [Gonapodya sp. JEL0774]
VYSGSLDRFEKFQVTPHIGLEFRGHIQLQELSDLELEDLSILVSQHGVVFLRQQNLSAEAQIEIGKRLSDSRSVHIFPINPPSKPGTYDEIRYVTNEHDRSNQKTNADDWHTDITFEKFPSSYAILTIVEGPEVGGDTLWASGYAAFSTLSPSLQTYLETLHAEHDGSHFYSIAQKAGIPFRTERGGGNVGDDLVAVHPVVRTNPVTGRKSLFVNQLFTKRIVELNKDESDALLGFLFRHVEKGVEFQVRNRWKPGDAAIWDNRSTFHAAIRDFPSHIIRRGRRVLALGEKPFLDRGGTNAPGGTQG